MKRLNTEEGLNILTIWVPGIVLSISTFFNVLPIWVWYAVIALLFVGLLFLVLPKFKLAFISLIERLFQVSHINVNKEGIRNVHQLFSEQFTIRLQDPKKSGSELSRIIANDEFILRYQPRLNLHDGTLVGMETLLGWKHPEQGILEPSQFIPIIEQSGQIQQIYDWVLITACEQGRKWLDFGFEFGLISINVSGQALGESFLEHFKHALNTTGMPANHLEIELTESSLMKSINQVTSTIKVLKELGVHIAIDDFGSGHSSIDYLSILRVNQLIVNQVDDVQSYREVMANAKALDIEVIAKGIEREDQLQLLLENGFSYGQGNLLDPPLLSDEASLLLSTRNQSAEN